MSIRCISTFGWEKKKVPYLELWSYFHSSCIFLQAHREVFEYLIEDFKTYKPLLSAIKNEYEMMFAYQRQQIRELEPLKVINPCPAQSGYTLSLQTV